MNNRTGICGFGINDSVISTSINGKKIKSYALWKSVITRCFKCKSYSDCSVCDEWKYFSNFKKWFDLNYIDGYELDKDLLVKGNKVYGPNTCCFIPKEINKLLVKQKKRTSNKLPFGVVRHSKNSFQVFISRNGKVEYLGVRNSQDDAFELYKNAKENHIKQVAQEYYKRNKITKRIYDALINYKIEINDNKK